MGYDLVIGGCGLFGATLGNLAASAGKKVLIIERGEIGGMCNHGVHIFHTSDRELWKYVTQFTEFTQVHYSPLVNNNDKFYSFPINLFTLHQVFGVLTEEEARAKLPLKLEGRNFEEKAINTIGSTLYELFYYHYTKKMWGVEPSKIPEYIFNRIPVRFNYDTNYFDDIYSGVPECGYKQWIKRMVKDCDFVQGDFIKEHNRFKGLKVFTGSIDELHEYKYGELPYRSLRFEKIDSSPAMAINYTDNREYTREINYNYFGEDRIEREFPCEGEPFYPVPWGKEMYEKYSILAGPICAGRLGEYKYINMDRTILNAFKLWSLIQI